MGARDTCFKLYWMAEKLIAPRLRYSQAVYEDVLYKCSNDIGSWLDLGCGHQLLPPWRFAQERSLTKRTRLLVGLDFDENSLRKHRTLKYRVRGNISCLPFPDETFDLVTSNMVFEHLNEPRVQLEEAFRVLRAGGMLVFHTPNSRSYGTILARLTPQFMKSKLIWFLQNRKEEDVFPTYYRMNTTKDIEQIAGATGFEVESVRLIVSSAQMVMIPPLVILELLVIRLLMTRFGKPFRSYIIAILKKPNCRIGARQR